MLRLSKITDYGTVVMTFMAMSPDAVHTAREITDQMHIGQPTVSKILKLLAHAGLLESYRGAAGGYRLTRAPAAISVADIVSALEGPIGITECSSSPGLCHQETMCPIRPNWQMINRAVLATLERISLAEMLRPAAPAISAASGSRSGAQVRQYYK
ncbi:MAG: SUF system Fe-S cluster assembly regulator [Gammaproteobacteria bacterium]|nr:SUF system Fe-S cluster assembly regulator [Gammaproteobacteria bacterium]MBA3730957.1 SUF system Fe-S cluster assembly regulator [Gammaproteobacteria bacterium]